jgi:hypothetical protein
MGQGDGHRGPDENRLTRENENMLRVLTRIPGVHALWRRFPVGSPDVRTRFDIWPRPAYAYGVWRAADLARALGLRGISVAEFGVAGGAGLIALEQVARAMAAHFSLEIDVLGFDSGHGMPAPSDVRDLPHVWAEGFYRMDEAKLRSRLQNARLRLGDLATTIPDALQDLRHPFGFLAFDLDYYSSTMQAFRVFEGEPASRLPRVFCYFDDLMWPERACHGEFTGEYAAIRDFNAEHSDKKLAQLANLRWLRERARAWNEQMYALHDFKHPRYAQNITPAGAEYRQLVLP